MNEKEYKKIFSEMVYLTAAAFLIIGYVTAQDPDCDYVQTVSILPFYRKRYC